MGHSEQTDLFLILACVIDFVNLLFLFPVVSEIMFGLQRLVIVVTWEKKGGYVWFVLGGQRSVTCWPCVARKPLWLGK